MPAWPEKPESKNPGGIPNVAADVPPCFQFAKFLCFYWSDSLAFQQDLCLAQSEAMEQLPMGLQVLAMGPHPLQILAKGLNQHQSCGPAMLYSGVVPMLRWPPSPETIPPGALAEFSRFTVLSGDVLGPRSDLKRSLHKLSQQASVDLSQITATSLSVCPQDHWSSATMCSVALFSQLGLEPNHTG